MGSREQALRSLVQGTAAGRLTVEQRQELVDHLEDAVEAKVAAGAGELDAVAAAFRELGDLKAIGSAYPRAWSPAALTSGIFGYAAMLALLFFAIFVTPRAFQAAHGRHVPAVLDVLLLVGAPVARYWLLFMIAPLAAGALAWRCGGARLQRVASFGFSAVMMVALVAHLFGVSVTLALR